VYWGFFANYPNAFLIASSMQVAAYPVKSPIGLSAKLLTAFHKAKIAFLNQVQHGNA
jgi:hypothetical protein